MPAATLRGEEVHGGDRDRVCTKFLGVFRTGLFLEGWVGEGRFRYVLKMGFEESTCGFFGAKENVPSRVEFRNGKPHRRFVNPKWFPKGHPEQISGRRGYSQWIFIIK